jgi:hypothetical protein
VWLGFSNDQIGSLLRDAGFEPGRIVALAADSKAKGPGLFVAVGQKITGSRLTSEGANDGDCS